MMDDNRLAKSQKMGNQIPPGLLNALQNVGAQVGYERRKKTGASDKTQDLVL